MVRKGAKGRDVWMARRRVFHVKGTASVKALRSACGWCDQESKEACETGMEGGMRIERLGAEGVGLCGPASSERHGSHGGI